MKLGQMATNSVYCIGQIIELTNELNIGGCRMKEVWPPNN